jgi:hypothetical protein
MMCQAGRLGGPEHVLELKDVESSERNIVFIRIRTLVVGRLYSVTALRENDNERATVYTKHRLTLHYNYA